ncbi:MAG TPA: LptA/OstA family protein [Kaistiaceae bacterium]|nr:LptA/OstA family protein [Kaistiaceae bacterium]
MSLLRPHLRRWLAAAALVGLSALVPASAQELSQGLVGFSSGSNDPILIESETLVVQDGGKVATFSGSVVVQQNETKLTTNELKVYYDGDTTGGGRQRIKRIEADGNVFVTNQDQTASGDHAIFDMATEVVTMLGNVELTQNGNAVRGDKLVVNLKTKESRVETSSGKPGRVQGLFLPGSNKDKPKTGKN